MRRAMLAVVLIAAVSGCRDVIPFQDITTITGYQLNGALTTASGVPIEGADVSLVYNYDFLSDTPADTVQVVVTKPVSFVDVAVYTTTYDLVRQLFFDNRNEGPVPHFYWNGRDRNNNLVPSGKYLIRYVIDTTIVKYTPWIVEGHTTAATDVGGKFTISGSGLPIGDVFDIYDNTNTYLGTYRVAQTINLRFTRLGQSSTYYDVGLLSNKITTRTFILQ